MSMSFQCFRLKMLRNRKQMYNMFSKDENGNDVLLCPEKVEYSKKVTGSNDPSISRAKRYGTLMRMVQPKTKILGKDIGFVPPPIAPLSNF